MTITELNAANLVKEMANNAIDAYGHEGVPGITDFFDNLRVVMKDDREDTDIVNLLEQIVMKVLQEDVA